MRKSDDRFVKMFIKDIGRIHSLSGNGLELFMYVAEHMDSNNKFLATPTVRKKMSEIIKVAPRTIDNLLNEVVKTGLIERETSHIYMMNPYVFGSGNSNIIDLKRINFMKIRYSNKGRTFELGEEKNKK